MSQKEKTDRIVLRKQRVEETSQRLIAEGYRKHDLSLDLVTANTRSLLYPIPFIALLLILFSINVGWSTFEKIDWFPLIVVYLLSVPIHEAIHGLFFGIFAEHHFEAIEFGIIWKSLNPYCYCSDPVRKGDYLTVILAPGTILGFLVGLVALALRSPTWMAFSVLNLFGAGGDFMSAWKLIRFPSKGKEMKVLDHPELPGMIVFCKD